MNHLSHKLSQLITEQPNPRTDHIDQLDSIEIMKLINDEDQQIAKVIRPLIPDIARIADRIVDSFERGGRLFYVGAGTSGRIGILDASECPPPTVRIQHSYKAYRRRLRGSSSSCGRCRGQ